MTLLQDGTEMTGPRALETLRRYSKRYDELAAAVEHAEHLAGQAQGAQVAHDARLAELATERQTAEAELTDLAARVDRAREETEKVERESAARVNEATAKVRIAETSLTETTAKLDAAQRDLAALQAKLASMLAS